MTPEKLFSLKTIRLPQGKRPHKVTLLASNQTPRTQVANGELRLRIPSILDHEVVAIDF